MARTGWSWRLYFLFAVIIGVVALAVTFANSDYARALREVERVGGRTNITWEHSDQSQPVRQVTLSGPSITDAEVAHVAPHLAQFPELFTLDLSMSRVTDQGLIHLRPYKSMGDLILRYTQVTDAGMSQLQEWNQLYTLDVMCTRISDRGVERIALHHPILRALDLDGTSVTDRGVAHLASMSRLEWLGLSETAVTDECLATVGQLRNLRLLTLSGTHVRGPGLKHLARSTALRTLVLKRVSVSDEDVNALQAKLPQLRIER